jgi:uncharacterized membrane protein
LVYFSLYFDFHLYSISTPSIFTHIALISVSRPETDVLLVMLSLSCVTTDRVSIGNWIYSTLLHATRSCNLQFPITRTNCP